MILSYNPYGNSSSNCLEIIIQHQLQVVEKSSDKDGKNGIEDNTLFIIIASSKISGVVGTSAVAIILRKRKLNRLKNLGKSY